MSTAGTKEMFSERVRCREAFCLEIIAYSYSSAEFFDLEEMEKLTVEH
mgnify:CR=1 FL=1